MRVIGVIPSRYASTRFPGKGLADICGKPMIWWVYQSVRKAKGLDDIVIAIDHEKTREACEKYNMPYVMTSDCLPEHISRIWEVSESIPADYYICINGDEPLIEADAISTVIPKEIHTEPVFFGAMRTLTDPAETIDFSNIKLAVTREGRCVYMSRTPIPYPRGTLFINYKKYIGIECFNKAALDFFTHTPMGVLEKAEDIDHLRFIENKVDLFFNDVHSESLSVDTPKDLEKVIDIIKSRDALKE